MDRRRILRSVRRLSIVSARLVEGLLAGNYRSVFRGPGIEFEGVREYVDSDDTRLIDWNVSSRLGAAYTKTYREEREVVLFVMVDLSLSMDCPGGGRSKRRIAAELVSLLALAAIRNNDKVGAVYFTDRIETWIPPKKGKKHALRLIHGMEGFSPAGRGSDLASALRASAEAMKRRGIVFIISDFKTGSYLQGLSVLARKHDVIVVRIMDEVDAEFPASGLFMLQDPETGRVLAAAGADSGFARAYQEHRQLERREFLRNCARRGVSVLDIDSKDDPGTKLVQFFDRRSSR